MTHHCDEHVPGPVPSTKRGEIYVMTGILVCIILPVSLVSRWSSPLKSLSIKQSASVFVCIPSQLMPSLMTFKAQQV